jgi:hypothetical protein
LSATSFVKEATNLKQVTKFLSKFDIEETSTDTFGNQNANLTILNKYVSDLDSATHVIFILIKLKKTKLIVFIFLFKKIICNDGSVFIYDKLCICTGGIPKVFKLF